MNILRITFAVFAMLLVATSQTIPEAAGKFSLPPDDWGGDHISMTVTADGADFEFDCATGHIKSPLALDAKGKFKANGTYKRERPAAAQVDDGGDGNTVAYSGSVKDNNMRLRIEIPGQEPMTYELTRGEHGRLTKCA